MLLSNCPFLLSTTTCVFCQLINDIISRFCRVTFVSSRPLSRQAVGQDHSDLVADLLKELSNHNERAEERKGALVELLKITREDNVAVWDEHFKTILLLLLETLGDKDVRYSVARVISVWTVSSPRKLCGCSKRLPSCSPAHDPSPGPARAEGNFEEPAGPIQKLR